MPTCHAWSASLVALNHIRVSSPVMALMTLSFFFFNDTATTEIYTLSLHDALPIYLLREISGDFQHHRHQEGRAHRGNGRDRKSTRLNSSHQIISYAVFCLKKKKELHDLAVERVRLFCSMVGASAALNSSSAAER